MLLQRLTYPKTLIELELDMIYKDFKLRNISQVGYITYTYPVGRLVTIKPIGEVVMTKSKLAMDRKRYNGRTDYEFIRLKDQSHSTGYFIDKDKDKDK